MLRQYVKLALRNIIRQKRYSLINVGGLAVGLAFALLVLLWVRYEYAVDRHHENLDQIYLVAFSDEDNKFHGDITVGALGPYLRETYPEITHATRYKYAPDIPFQYGGEKYVVRGNFVDPDFLSMFSFDFLEGSPENALESPASVVITSSLADRMFGDGEAVGKALKVDEQLTLTVSAVVDDLPSTSRFQFDYLLSCAVDPGEFSSWDVKDLNSFVMLAPGTNPDVISKKISNAYNDHNPGASWPNYQYLFPFRDLYLHNLYGDGRIIYVRMFSLLAIIVLLCACVNFTNLSTARASTRFREIGVKKVLGAGRGQIAWQFLIEAGIITLAATVIAIVLVEVFLPGLNAIAGTQVTLGLSWATLGLMLAVAVVTALFSGSYPALYLSSFRPINALRGATALFGDRESSGGKRLRQVLVVLQFAASIALVLGVLGIFGQMRHISDLDVGFNKDHVVIFTLPREAVAHSATIKNTLLANSDIESVTTSYCSLVRWQSSVGIDWEGKDHDRAFAVGRNWVDHDYAGTFQIDMVEGRFFSPEMPSDKQEAIVINEACVRAMDIADPVGRRITIAPGSSIESHGTIVGVIRDHHTESARTEIQPFLFRLSERGRHMCVRVNPEKIGASMQFMRETISELVPGATVNFRFYDDLTAPLYKDEILTGKVFVYVTIIAIFISCLGLYGLAAFTARRRAKEISIRRVFGASITGVVGLLSREFLILIMAAGIIASPFAWYGLNLWLEGFAFRMTLGPTMFLSATGIACLIGLMTIAGQAYRAATRNPAETLHQTE
jgi:ABC-type antimicrobial peptide transport system permease subunit